MNGTPIGTVATILATPMLAAAGQLTFDPALDAPSSLWVQFGVATPLVVVLIWLIRTNVMERKEERTQRLAEREAERIQREAERVAAAAERQKLTDRFLQTLETTIAKNAEAVLLGATSARDLASAVSESTARRDRDYERLAAELAQLRATTR